MGNRECQKERWGTFCIMTLLCIAFMVVNLVDFPGLGSTVYAASVPQGAYDPDTYQGITYTIHGNNGSYGTKEVDKVFDNVFYYKDVIVVEDTDITANGEGNSYSFSLISYDATETVSNGFVTLKTLEDKGIVRITDGTVLDDTLSDSMKGQTTIQRIEFINPNCVVMFAISRSDSSHPCYSGSKMKDGKSYAGVVACIDYATVYATSCEVSYSYTGLESDYLWQDGVKSQLPQTLYLPIPGCRTSLPSLFPL